MLPNSMTVRPMGFLQFNIEAFLPYKKRSIVRDRLPYIPYTKSIYHIAKE